MTTVDEPREFLVLDMVVRFEACGETRRFVCAKFANDSFVLAVHGRWSSGSRSVLPANFPTSASLGLGTRSIAVAWPIDTVEVHCEIRVN